MPAVRILLVSLLLAAASLAQPAPPQVEEGKPAELKGLTRLAIVAQDPACLPPLREHFDKALKNLEVVEDPAEAQVILVLTTAWEREPGPEPAPSGCSCQPQEPKKRETIETCVVVASLLKPLGPNHVRRLLLVRRTGPREDILIERVATEIEKAWKKANR